MQGKTLKVGPIVVFILIAMTFYLIKVFNRSIHQEASEEKGYVATPFNQTK